MKYFINYHTGAGDFSYEGDLDGAKAAAESGIAYTQHPVTIYDDSGSEVAYLPWWGTAPGEDDVVTARFGDLGFYGEWQEV